LRFVGDTSQTRNVGFKTCLDCGFCRWESGDHRVVIRKRNLLLVLLDGVPARALRQAVLRRMDGAANVHVVAPTRVGMLDWLATDEDDARAAAEVRRGVHKLDRGGAAPSGGPAG
jgi:hypothetical protein